jgi:hypothetical protein
MITAKKKKVLEKNMWVKAGRFKRGGCTPQNPAPLAAAGVREELLQGLFAPRTEKWKRALAIRLAKLLGARERDNRIP